MNIINSRKNWLSQATDETSSNDARNILRDASTRGGLVARFQMKRNMDKALVGLADEATDVLISSKREELRFRAQIELDRVKKQAIADSMADTADIEREIVRMTVEVKNYLDEFVQENCVRIYELECKRLAGVEKAIENGQMLPDRLHEARQRLASSTTEHVQSVEAVAQRMIENLGARLSRALNLDDATKLGRT